jgi:hypothetical protein
MTAEVEVSEEAVTAVMTGAPVVAKVKFAEVAVPPDALAEITA